MCSILSIWVLQHYRWANTCTLHTIPETALLVFLISHGRGKIIFEKHAYSGTVTINSKYYQLAFISIINVWIYWSLAYTYTIYKCIQHWQLSHLKKIAHNIAHQEDIWDCWSYQSSSFLSVFKCLQTAWIIFAEFSDHHVATCNKYSYRISSKMQGKTGAMGCKPAIWRSFYLNEKVNYWV